MSAIGWVDFSSEHREKVKSVLDLLSEPGVVDELGIGTIRDSFSDSLFPGISTIQTRAKYFLTVPRIFKDYKKLPPNKRLKLADYLNQQENLCMRRMVANHQDDRQGGIIGSSFADKEGEVQRKPSSVYWVGICQFKLIQPKLSLQDFCRRFANPKQPLVDLIQGSETTKGDDPDAARKEGEVINGPGYEDGWIDTLTVHLTKDEAEFLSSQIGACVPNSLLGEILRDPDVQAQFLDLPAENFTDFADEAPFIKNFPSKLQQVIAAARNFWQLMYGAHIRYNCLLQEKHGTKERHDEFELEWKEWQESIKIFPWNRWETDLLWNLAECHGRKIQRHTKEFVNSWITAVHSGDNVKQLDKIVIQQENCNKKGHARLRQGAEESISDWVGIKDLNYRFNEARNIIRDIQQGLIISEGDDAGH